MRTRVPAKLENGRVSGGAWGSTSADAMTGAFIITGPNGAKLRILSSGADTQFGWEHVSVSLDWRTPRWDEMSFVKDLFWGEDECVVQYHPPRLDHVNHHPFCLHLWKPTSAEIPRPPTHLVGPKQSEPAA